MRLGLRILENALLIGMYGARDQTEILGLGHLGETLGLSRSHV
jgi:hypothetical protein